MDNLNIRVKTLGEALESGEGDGLLFESARGAINNSSIEHYELLVDQQDAAPEVYVRVIPIDLSRKREFDPIRLLLWQHKEDRVYED